MNKNLGATSLKKRRRSANPMDAYDALPEPLRLWLAAAALPWSPQSCKRIWDKARKSGQSVEEAISILSRAEQKNLARDKVGLLG
ncbi:DUF6525 family protein [Sulfitobacter donghicola]|uniref:DUF6525 family protein n=1 Tax=Sulfitobacter donghicola TaxID=421000 RepID=UPI0009DF2362|nr:DUF6525 family protein [Sulfitobacter donghicola]KIN68493.1 hypothetical protein Z948_2224 [Sulfitobacter donghicola DSW-25 = KCTC 12864 = JCM 14565]